MIHITIQSSQYETQVSVIFKIYLNLKQGAMCHLCWHIGPKSQMLEDIEHVESMHFLSLKSHQFFLNGCREEVKNISANQRSGRPSCSSYRPKNTNLAEDVEFLLPVKFRKLNSVLRFQRRSRKCLSQSAAKQRPGWPSCFYDRPEKQKLCREHCVFASCQVSSNSVNRFR